MCVVYDNGVWQYDCNTAYHAFEPLETDILIAEVDFVEDTVNDLAGANGEVHSITSGDLVFTPNYWGGNPNMGEFQMSGTGFAPNVLMAVAYSC